MVEIEKAVRHLWPAMPVFGGLSSMSRLWVLFVPLMLMAAIACVQPTDEEVVEGILQNVDSVNGEITIETKDGQTVTLKLGAGAPVETDGTSSDLESLVAGASVEIEVKDDGRVVQRIKSRQAKAEGVVVRIEGDEVTVESDGGRSVTIRVTDRTGIRLGDDSVGSLDDLLLGARVGIKFDPENRVALNIFAEQAEPVKAEGVVVEVTDEGVTVEMEGGRTVNLVIGARTHIQLEGGSGTVADLQPGLGVGVKFDPQTRIASVILVLDVEERRVKEPEPVGIEGVVVAVTDQGVAVETEEGRTVRLVIGNRTRIEVEGRPGTLADLGVGAKVAAKFNPQTRMVFNMVILDQGRARVVELEVVKIEGILVDGSDRGVTVETPEGRRVTLVISERTHIDVGDRPGTMDDLHFGAKVVVKFDRDTRTVLTIIVLDQEGRRVDDEGNKFEAVIVDITDSEVTVETDGGRKVGVLVDERTHIEVNGHPGTLEDLSVGAEVAVWFDPGTHTALAIIAFGDDGSGIDDDDNKFEAVILDITGNEVTVETEDGRTLGVLVDERTHIEVNGHPGTLEDLLVGERVGIWFDPATYTALAIFAFEDEERRVDDEGRKIEAVIVDVTDNEVTVETEDGRKVGVLVDEHTHIEVNGHRGTLEDLWVGARVGVWFDPETHRAFAIVAFEGDVRRIEETEGKKLEAVIVEIGEDQVIVETDDGKVGLLVGERTQIEVNGRLAHSMTCGLEHGLVCGLIS